MGGQREIAKPLSYVVVIVGCVLAMVSALAPLPTGSYKLSGVYLMLGIIPYIVYGTFTELLQSYTLIGAGLVLLVVDFLARFGAQVVHVANASAMPALYLCLVLTFLVFPVGAALGHLIAKFWPWETQ